MSEVVVFSSELEGAEPNYRQRLAAALPALLLFYVLIVVPLLYGGTVAADVNSATVAAARDYALNRLVFPLVFVTALMLYQAERPRFAAGSGAVLVLFAAFWGLCAVSAGWSLVPGKTISQFLLTSVVIGSLGMAAVVAGSVERILRALFWVVVLAIALNVVSVLTTPAGPIGHQGIYDHKNTLGAVAAAAILFGLWGLTQGGELRAMRYLSALMIPAALVVLAMSESKTSLGLAFVAPALALGLCWTMASLRLSLPVALGIMLAAVLAGAWFLGESGFTLGDVSQVISGDPTFTGRTELWSFAGQHIAEKPWLGWGFRSFWQIGDMSPQLTAAPGFLQRTPNGHNGYIDILLQVGVVGFGLFVALVFAVSGRIGRVIRRAPALGWFMTTLFLFIVLHALLESTWFEVLDPMSAFFLALLVAPLGDAEATR